MEMKRRLILLVLIAVLLFSVSANATPTIIGTALYGTSNYHLIYEEDSPFGPITWLDYTSVSDTWENQVDWASELGSNLTVTLNPRFTTTLDWGTGWRLPETVDGLLVWGYDGTTTAGANIKSSEMGYLFYESLRNKSYYYNNGNYPQPGWGLVNTGDFDNLEAYVYWSGTEYSLVSLTAWTFIFGYGSQTTYGNLSSHYALAVRPGQVFVAPIPIPAAMLLLGSGLAGLSIWRHGTRRKHS